MLKTEYKGKLLGKKYQLNSSINWYRYEAKRLIVNIEKISEIFPNKKYIGANDIIEHIVYCKYGCHVLLENLRKMKRRVKELEDQIKNGKWINNNSVSLSNVSTSNIENVIENISNRNYISGITSAIHNDFYKSYFLNTIPNIELSEAKIPHFPILPRETVLIEDKEKVKKMIEETIPYLNVLEILHNNTSKLIEQVNFGIEVLLTV
jgi:hypothetical protein